MLRKPDPSKRKNIHVVTFKRVEQFLKDQVEPVFKSEIVKQCGIDFNSVGVALKMINHKIDDKGRIYLDV